MKKNLFNPNFCSVLLLFILSPSISQAMPGMHDSGIGAATEHPRVSNSIGGKINTSGSEMEITYSADGKTAIFVSTRTGSVQSPGGNYSFDIWMSRLADGVWQAAKNWNDVPELSSINTSTGEEHCPIIASDSLIYFSYHQPGVTQDSDIWKVEKKDGVWQKPVSLGPKINSPQRDHMHWTGLSKDGKSLIITSMRTDLGSRGGHDEWIAQQNADGEWREPVNLGDAINTGGEDMCWTFTPDGMKFTGSWGPHGTYDMDLRSINKNDVPLLKQFEPIGPPPNLLSSHKAKSGANASERK